jgi:hypothetical protein
MLGLSFETVMLGLSFSEFGVGVDICKLRWTKVFEWALISTWGGGAEKFLIQINKTGKFWSDRNTVSTFILYTSWTDGHIWTLNIYIYIYYIYIWLKAVSQQSTILPRVAAIKDGVRIGNWIYWPPTGLTTNNYYTTADLHNLQSLHTNVFNPIPGNRFIIQEL